MQASGLKWVNIGDKKPETGVELMNDELAMALAKEPEGTDGVKSFDPEEWEKKDGFGCGKDAKEWNSALRMEHYIFSSGSYYKPSTRTGEIIFEKSGEVGYLRDCRDFDNVDGSHFFKAVDFYQAADILAPRFYRFLDQVPPPPSSPDHSYAGRPTSPSCIHHLGLRPCSLFVCARAPRAARAAPNCMRARRPTVCAPLHARSRRKIMPRRMRCTGKR